MIVTAPSSPAAVRVEVTSGKAPCKSSRVIATMLPECEVPGVCSAVVSSPDCAGRAAARPCRCAASLYLPQNYRAQRPLWAAAGSATPGQRRYVRVGRGRLISAGMPDAIQAIHRETQSIDQYSQSPGAEVQVSLRFVQSASGRKRAWARRC